MSKEFVKKYYYYNPPEEVYEVKDMENDRQNVVTIGGVVLQRKSGGYTITAPVCQYGNVTDAQLQEFWHWFATNQRVQQAVAEFNQAVSAELIAWGDARNLEVKKEGK